MQIIILKQYHLKGDALFYRPDGFLGWCIARLAGGLSHTSRAAGIIDDTGAALEYDAAIEQDNFGFSRIEWNRSPWIVPLPHCDKAHLATIKKFAGEEYATLQVASKGLVILTGWEWLCHTGGVDCAEALGFYLSKHWLYLEAVAEGKISKKLQRKIAKPDLLTPRDCWKVCCKMAALTGRKPIKRYKVQ